MFAVVYVLVADVALRGYAGTGLHSPRGQVNVQLVNVYHVNEQLVKTRRATCARSNIENKGRSVTPIIALFKIKNVDINITRNMINCL